MKGKVTMIGEVEVYRISGVGHNGSRSTGAGWWAKLPDGRFLAESQGSGWPPYPVIAVSRNYAIASKTKREAVALAERYKP